MKMDRKKKKPRPLTGKVIAPSTVPMTRMIAGMAILEAAGLGLIGGWFAGWGVWALVVGLVVMTISVAGIAVAILRTSNRERVFIGTDRFQIVHRIRGEDVVNTQVRFANVASLTLEEGDKNYIGINLVDLDDLDAYQADDNFETTRRSDGHHVLIWDRYTEPLSAIYGMLSAKVAEEAE